MFVIGITGGIGSGKTSFANLLSKAGLHVLDADQISHQVTGIDGRSIPKIKEAFGKDFIKADGSLNREKMADLAFQDKKALDSLSDIVHSDVFASMEESIKTLGAASVPVVVLDVPIPVEHGFLDRSDVVVCIWADDEIRLNRLIKRGMEAEEAKRRMAIQMSKEEYQQISDYFYLNNGSHDQLREKALDFLEKELASRGISYSQDLDLD